MIHVILLWYKKGSNAKKESYCCTEPQKIAPSLPLKIMKSKKENQAFLSRQFCASLNIRSQAYLHK
jgi:hypothetical protein